MTTTSNKWYLRLKGEVKGPYPAGLVSRYLLLGRVSDVDEVSSDGEQWVHIKEVPDLIPEVMKGDISDPLVQERLQAARRWADERSKDRRLESGQQATRQRDRRGSERREPEHSSIIEHRHRRTGREHATFMEFQGRWTTLMIAAVIAVFAGVFFLLYKPPPPQLGADCRSPAAPMVNWSNCAFDGADLEGVDLTGANLYSANLTAVNLRNSNLKTSDLSYAALSVADLESTDLRGASLMGAKLRQAKLNNAHLDNADLSYADLTGADLTGVSMHNTKFGNAIWTDGRRCLPKSVGACQSR